MVSVLNKTKPTDLALAISDFLFWHLPNQKGLQENSVKSYTDAISLFMLYCESELGLKREKMSIKDISCQTVEGFLDWLENERHNSPRSRNQRKAALNTFFKYLQRKNPAHILLFQEIKAIPQKKLAVQSVKHLSVDEVSKLLAQPPLNTRMGRRNFAILSLLYETGARVSEVATLTIGDIRFSRNGASVYLLGKGGKAREVPLVNSVATFIKRYLADEAERRSCLKSDILFCNRNNEKLTRAGIAYILKEHFKTAQSTNPEVFPKRVYPHILRHSRAMHWLEAGIDLQYIKDLLGHADIVTTEIYAQLSVELKRKLMGDVHQQITPDDAISSSSWTDDKNLVEWLKGFSEK